MNNLGNLLQQGGTVGLAIIGALIFVFWRLFAGG